MYLIAGKIGGMKNTANSETITAYLRRRLLDTVGWHSQIAKECGIPQSTLSRFFVDPSCSPRLATVEPLLDWFARYDKATKRKLRSAKKSNHEAEKDHG